MLEVLLVLRIRLLAQSLLSRSTTCGPFSGWRASAPHSRILTLWLFTDRLPWRACGHWLDNLRRNDELLLDQQHAGVVIDSAAVVGAGGDGDQLICAELIDGLCWILVRAHNHRDLVLLEELINDIRAVAHNIVLFLRVARHVHLHAEDFIVGGRVTPHDVHAHLLHSVLDVAQCDPEWPLNLVNVFKPHDRVADAAMDAEDAILGLLVKDNCTERHPFKQVVHLLEHGAWLINVLAEALGALLAETEILVDIAVLVVASQQENLPRIL